MPQICCVDLLGQYWPQIYSLFWEKSDVAEVRIGGVVPAQQQSDREMDRVGQGGQVAEVFVRDELQTWLGLSLWAH